MPSASERINTVLGGAANISGAASGIANLPGIPQGVKDAVGNLFGTGGGVAPAQNRRDLSNFLSTINRYGGLSRTTYFYVEMSVPYCFRSGTQREATASVNRNLVMLCDSASIPGISFSTSDVRRYGYGPQEKKPISPVFVDSTLTFMVDARQQVLSYFTVWMNSILNFSDNPFGDIRTAGTNNLKAFEVNYKEQYAVDIAITSVDEQNNDIRTVFLNQAYPIFLGDVSLSWSDNDSIARLPVTFTYFNWRANNLKVNQQLPKSQGSFIQSLLKVGTALQTLSTLKKPRSVGDIVNSTTNIGRVLSF